MCNKTRMARVFFKRLAMQGEICRREVCAATLSSSYVCNKRGPYALFRIFFFAVNASLAFFPKSSVTGRRGSKYKLFCLASFHISSPLFPQFHNMISANPSSESTYFDVEYVFLGRYDLRECVKQNETHQLSLIGWCK